MLKIIGSGFGRTGTLSLKAALEQLGFGPCYHMSEIISKPKRMSAWSNIGRGRPADWREMMKGYRSSVDFPACIYYRELMRAFPDAKIVHTVREPERWYQSMYETVYQFSNLSPLWARRLISPLRNMTEMATITVWDGVFKGDFENRQRTIEIFQQHTETVKRTVPPENLLVFSIKEGWEPLCKFLQVPIPDTHFPHLNDSAQMKRVMRRLSWLFRWGPVALGAVLFIGIGVLVNALR
jgi:hypothetical protein